MPDDRSSLAGARHGDAERPGSSPAAAVLDVGTILLLPALTVYLGLNAGGYFADTIGWAAAALAVMLAVRVALCGVAPLVRGRLQALAAATLAVFGAWTLLSASWSGDLGVALLEFDRVLLYLLVLLVFGSLEEPRRALRHLPLGFALAAVFLCAVALATRTLPDLWPFGPGPERGNLAYPVTYSNGLGVLAALAMIVCLHLASWEREWVPTRIIAAAALPLLAATLALTLSDGAVAAGAVGVGIYAVLARPRGLLTALLAAVPFVVLAAGAAEGADLLAGGDPRAAAALEQGRELARTVGLAMLGGAGCLAVLVPIERRLGRTRIPGRRRAAAVGAVVLALGAAGAAVAVLPSAVGAVTEELEGAETSKADSDGGSTGALSVLGAERRADYWRVALDAFEAEPITGTGVGGFAERWARDRPDSGERVEEGHSVYLETLGELGVVGVALLVLVFGAMVAACVIVARRVSRPLGAVALGAAATWLLHAGFDWDWELPVVTVWLFAFGGCALAAAPGRRSSTRTPSLLPRALAASACLLAAVTPTAIAISQTRLDGAMSAFLRGDCDEAERLAASASTVLSPRAEPYEVLGYCASRRGAHDRAISMMKRAIERDPDSWELQYGLGIVRGAAGEDPRAAARRAWELNHLEPIAQGGVDGFEGDGPRGWRRHARSAALPLP